MTDPLSEAKTITDTSTAQQFAGQYPWYIQLLAIVITVAVALLLRFVLKRVITRLARRIGDSPLRQRKLFPGRSQAILSERREQRTQTAAALLQSVGTVVVMAIALVLCLYFIGVDLVNVFAGVGVVSLIIGFGAREIISDFLAGILMLGADQYGVGDVVDVGPVVGTVEAVGLRTTRVRDADGAVWYVRNGQIPRIGNLSQGWGRAVVDVPVPPDRDPQEVRALLARVGRAMRDEPHWQGIMIDEPDVPGIVSLASDHYVIQVTARTSPLRAEEVAAALRERFTEELDTATAEATEPADDTSDADKQSDADGPAMDVIRNSTIADVP